MPKCWRMFLETAETATNQVLAYSLSGIAFYLLIGSLRFSAPTGSIAKCREGVNKAS
jgi:hypothetical protein